MTRLRLANAALIADVSVLGISVAQRQHREGSSRLVELATLRRSPWQPRTTVLRNAEFEALVESVRTHGVLQPVLVLELADGARELLAGERRVEASKCAGLTEIRAHIYTGLTTAQARAIALTENLARADLSPWEAATALEQLRSVRQQSGEPTDVRTLGALVGRAKTQVAELRIIAEGISPDVITHASELCGQDLSLGEVTKAKLLSIAKGADPAARALRLARLVKSPAPLRTQSPPFSVRYLRSGATEIKLRRAVDAFSPDEAKVVLKALRPLTEALMRRASAKTDLEQDSPA